MHEQEISTLNETYERAVDQKVKILATENAQTLQKALQDLTSELTDDHNAKLEKVTADLNSQIEALSKEKDSEAEKIQNLETAFIEAQSQYTSMQELINQQVQDKIDLGSQIDYFQE